MDDCQNTIQGLLKQRIEQTFGQKVLYPFQCHALAGSIAERTGQSLGVTTLKRLFGFTTGKHNLRRSTLDILCKYIGSQNYDLFEKNFRYDYEISQFKPIETVESSQMGVNDLVKIAYHPDRMLLLRNLGNSRFIVLQSENSKIKQGDVIVVGLFAKGFEFICADVVRDGVSLGTYVGARQGGLTSVHVFSKK